MSLKKVLGSSLHTHDPNWSEHLPQIDMITHDLRWCSGASRSRSRSFSLVRCVFLLAPRRQSPKITLVFAFWVKPPRFIAPSDLSLLLTPPSRWFESSLHSCIHTCLVKRRCTCVLNRGSCSSPPHSVPVCRGGLGLSEVSSGACMGRRWLGYVSELCVDFALCKPFRGRTWVIRRWLRKNLSLLTRTGCV